MNPQPHSSRSAWLGLAALGLIFATMLPAQSAGELTVNGATQEVAEPLTLTGDAFPLATDDLAFESTGQRNALVVYGLGLLSLKAGAEVTVQNANNLTAFLRVGYGSEGTLEISDGASLAVGSATRYANIQIGQGAAGTVNQTGGEVTSIGSFNLGVNGGTGTYTISGGTLTFDHAGPDAANRTTLISVGFNNATAAVGTSTGTLNLAGGMVELRPVQTAGEGEAVTAVRFFIGNRAKDALQAYSGSPVNTDNAGAGNGTVTQTGGIFRVGAGADLYLSGYGHGVYNLNGGALEIGGSSLHAQYGNHAQYTYALNLGGGSIRVIGGALDTAVDASLTGGTTSTIDTNGLGAVWRGNLTGNGTLVKTGAGALALTGANQLTGEAYVRGGSVDQSTGTSTINYLAVGSGAANIGEYNLSGGTLSTTQALQVGDWSGAGTFNQSGGTVNVTGSFNVGNQGGTGEYNLTAGTLNLAGGLYSLGRNTDTKPAGSGTFNLSGTGVLEVAGGNFIIGNRDATATEGNGSGVFNQTGGVFRLSGTTGADNLFLSGYGDGVYNLLGGVLEIGGNHLQARYGSGTGSHAFNLGGGTIRVIGSDFTTAVRANLVGATTSTVDTNGFNATFSAGFTGAGGLAKAGSGELRLGGNSDYTGATTITAGTLRVDGVLENSFVTVGDGGTLAGHGTVAGITVQNGGNLAPGGAAGAFTVGGDLTLAADSRTLLRIAGAGSHDQLTVMGTIFAGGVLQVEFMDDFNPLESASYPLFQAVAFDGTFTQLLLPALGGGLVWDTSDLYASGILSIGTSAVPEPSAWAAITGVVALGLGLARRRRRRVKP